MANTSRSVRSARVLLLVSASVVVSFFAATMLAERQAGKIAGSVDEIVSNAMPSVESLSRARAALVEVLVALDQIGAGRPPAGLADRILSGEREIGASVAAYLALPFFPAEQAVAKPLPDAVPAFQRSMDDLVEAARTPGAVGSQGLAERLAIARRRALALDDDLARVVEFDSEQGQRLGVEILRARDHSRTLLILLDCLAGALALLATGLAARALGRTLARAEHRATDAERRTSELDQFSGRVAHDLVGPISVAALALQQTARENDDDERLARMTARGLAALHRVRALVDGLLRFARAGARPEPGARTDVRKVAEELMDGLAPEADAASVELSMNPVPDCTVACSPGVLMSLLGNLLRNSFKHMGSSPERRVRLSIAPTAAGVRFEIVDTGPGIPAELRPRIFEPYFRLPGTGAPGLGLGLATVERLVHAHEGTLGVHAGEAGAGSTFWFELPRADLLPVPARALHEADGSRLVS
jgi:signal transduction histidine kinase